MVKRVHHANPHVIDGKFAISWRADYEYVMRVKAAYWLRRIAFDTLRNMQIESTRMRRGTLRCPDVRRRLVGGPTQPSAAMIRPG